MLSFTNLVNNINYKLEKQFNEEENSMKTFGACMAFLIVKNINILDFLQNWKMQLDQSYSKIY